MSDIGLVSNHPLREATTAAANRIEKSELSRFSGWYGVWCLIATEASLFAYLFFSYYYSLLQSAQHWPLQGQPSPLLPSLTTLLLVGSSVALAFSQSAVLGPASEKAVRNGLAVALLCGATGFLFQTYDLFQKAPRLSKTTYDSYYVLITALDCLHLVVGIAALAGVFFWFCQGLIVGPRRAYVSIVAAYWHFAVLVSLCLFAALTLQPLMG